MRYAVVYEKGKAGYGAYVPDLPGCVAVGKTLRRVQRLIREAIAFHLEGMREDGEPIPQPTSLAESVAVRLPAHAAKASLGNGRKRVTARGR